MSFQISIGNLGSFYKFLKVIYYFKYMFLGYWDIPENVKRCMDWVAADLLIKEPHQWTRISTPQLREKGLHSLVVKFGNIQNILEFCYPEYNWQQHHKDFWLVNNTAKIQQQLFTYIKEALPNERIENRIVKQEE